VIEESDLAVNLLEFRQKSFQFDRVVALGAHEYALFLRTETESESRLRPKLVHLTVVVPREWIAYDAELDLLRLSQDGQHLAARIPGMAIESAAEPSEFSEQGIAWKRVEGPVHVYRYLPADRLAELGSEEGRTLLARPQG
jgi:hypothetical protein